MMSNDQNGQANLIERARTLLSPYLDDQVTPAERKLVETLLAQSPELQTELESLRQTVSLVKSLPRVPAPRPFTLTEADVGLSGPQEKTPSWWGWLRPVMGGVAVLAAILIVGVYLFNTTSFQSAQPAAETMARAPGAVQPEAAEEIAAEADVAQDAASRAAPEEAAPAAEVAEEVLVTQEVELMVAPEAPEVEKVVEREVVVGEEVEAKEETSGADDQAGVAANGGPEALEESAPAEGAAGAQQPLPAPSPTSEVSLQPAQPAQPTALPGVAGLGRETTTDEAAEALPPPANVTAPAVLPATPTASATAAPLPTSTPAPESTIVALATATPFPTPAPTFIPIPTTTPFPAESQPQQFPEAPVVPPGTATATPPPTVLAQTADEDRASDAAEATEKLDEGSDLFLDEADTRAFIAIGLVVVAIVVVLAGFLFFWLYSRER